MASTLNPWATLGVSELAGEAEVRRAYRKQALRLHPDVNQGCSEAHAQFMSVNEAYRLLTSRGRSPPGGAQEGGSSSWDIHDWYWTFVSNRWAKRKGGAAAAAAAQPHRAVSAPQGQLSSQLTELKRRARQRASSAVPGRRVYAHPARDEGEDASEPIRASAGAAPAASAAGPAHAFSQGEGASHAGPSGHVHGAAAPDQAENLMQQLAGLKRRARIKTATPEPG